MSTFLLLVSVAVGAYLVAALLWPREVLTMALIGIGIILGLFGLCFLFIDLEERL